MQAIILPQKVFKQYENFVAGILYTIKARPTLSGGLRRLTCYLFER